MQLADNVVSIYLTPASHVAEGLRNLAGKIDAGEAHITQAVLSLRHSDGDVGMMMLSQDDTLAAIGLLDVSRAMIVREALD